MNWFIEALNKKNSMESNGQVYTYSQIASDFGVHYDTVRKKFRDERRRKMPIVEEKKEIISKATIMDMFLEGLKRGGTMKELCESLAVPPIVFKSLLEQAKEDGYNVFENKDYFKISKVAIPTSRVIDIDWDGNQILKFGIVSDTHLGSKYQQLSHLNKIYDIFEKEEIKNVFHVGDITEGVNMRKGHEYELFLLGVDAQADYVIEKYPRRDGIVTDFITGNHDHTGIKAAGTDIGIKIARERTDMHYLGLSNARVKITPNCIMELNHSLDGASYALSYALQKSIDALDNNDLPNIFLNGHHHKLMYTYYRNIHALECGTFEAQTPWMKGKRIAAHVGGIILTVHVDKDGKVVRFLPEFIPFYDKKEKDW